MGKVDSRVQGTPSPAGRVSVALSTPLVSPPSLCLVHVKIWGSDPSSLGACGCPGVSPQEARVIARLRMQHPHRHVPDLVCWCSQFGTKHNKQGIKNKRRDWCFRRAPHCAGLSLWGGCPSRPCPPTHIPILPILHLICHKRFRFPSSHISGKTEVCKGCVISSSSTVCLLSPLRMFPLAPLL